MRLAQLLALAGLVLCAALTRPVAAHGASRGMHLHVEPDPVTAGAEVTVDVTAERKLDLLRIGFTGRDPLTLQPDPPVRRLTVPMTVPQVEPGALNLHAEGRTVEGGTLRASAVLQVEAAD